MQSVESKQINSFRVWRRLPHPRVLGTADAIVEDLAGHGVVGVVAILLLGTRELGLGKEKFELRRLLVFLGLLLSFFLGIVGIGIFFGRLSWPGSVLIHGLRY